MSTVVAADSFAPTRPAPLLRRRLERRPEAVGPAAGPVLWAGASGCVPGAAAALAVAAAPHGRFPPPGGSGAADG
ncbi:hypothetical protein [Streptomyces hygroscopicus]|uniref:hypothetical protein n=1 Tax=Streptomyces hygroscopicus TaxID=1912 RepID=UPI00117C8CC1|nr:hypothetical protein [Streptomyces hygroscopicus]